MQTIEVNKGIRIGFEEIIKGVQQLDNSALAKFAGEINSLLAKRTAQISDLKEADILKRIKSNIPPSVKRRQKELYEKLQADIISETEKKELILLNDMIEQKVAERILLIGELAKRRNISIQQLALELNINS